MNNPNPQVYNTKPKSSVSSAYYAMAWLGFIVPLISYVVGILRTPVLDLQTKGFYSICFVFALYSTFNLAKTIRDRAEGL
jgi:hypothetical protein